MLEFPRTALPLAGEGKGGAAAYFRPHLAGHWGSKYGIEEFLEVKYLCIGGIDR
jgi:hypothetical protein